MNRRESGLDIYRIIAMLMITALHINYQHLAMICLYMPKKVFIAGYLIEYACFAGVNCFAMLSGWLMGGKSVAYDRKYFARTLHFYLKMVLWSLLLYFSCLLLLPGRAAYSWEYMKLNLLVPVGHWWYISSYFGLLFLMPLLNLALVNISRRNLLHLALLLFAVFSILPTYSLSEGALMLNNGYSTLWLITCFIFGTALREFRNRIMEIRHIKWILSGVLAFCILYPFGFQLTGIFTESGGYGYLMNYLSPFCTLQAAVMLLLCADIRIKSPKLTKVITFISANSLGIYLWHTYPLIFNTWIIQQDVPAHRGSELLWKFPALLLGISLTGIVLNFLIDRLDQWCRLKILSEKAVRLFADRCNCRRNG